MRTSSDDHWLLIATGISRFLIKLTSVFINTKRESVIMSWMHYTEHEIGNALEALEADGIALQQHETFVGASNRTAKLRGTTPLQHALENNAPEAEVIALLAACPDAAKVKSICADDTPRHPLHDALKNNASEAVVLALLAAWPVTTTTG